MQELQRKRGPNKGGNKFLAGRSGIRPRRQVEIEPCQCSPVVCAVPHPKVHQDQAGGPTRCCASCWETRRVCCISMQRQRILHAVPPSIFKAFMMINMTALQKRDGGVRGIATGTSFRRLVARTLARQFSTEVEAVCAPFQFTLSTRAGHAVWATTDANPMTKVLSVDGIGACDHVYRAAMMSKLLEVPSLRHLLPFVRQACGSTTSYSWQDADGKGTESTKKKGVNKVTH